MSMKTGGPKRIRGIQIRSPAHLGKLLNELINKVLKGQLSTEELRAVVYASSILLKCFESSDFAKRLDALEAKILKKEF